MESTSDHKTIKSSFNGNRRRALYKVCGKNNTFSECIILPKEGDGSFSVEFGGISSGFDSLA